MTEVNECLLFGAKSSVDGLHGATVHGQWTISAGGTVEYKTACVTVQVD